MYLLISVAVMAGITYIIRMLPITFFNKPIRSVRIRSFLYYIPYSVLAALTFPAVLEATGDVVSSVAGTVMALVLSFFDKGLVLVAAGAVAGALLFSFL